MEPKDLDPNSSPDGDFDTHLRALAGGPALADNGFSARVLAALPPPQERAAWPWVITGAAIMVGLTLALAGGALVTNLGAALAEFAGAASSPEFVVPLAIVLAVLALAYAAEESVVD